MSNSEQCTSPERRGLQENSVLQHVGLYTCQLKQKQVTTRRYECTLAVAEQQAQFEQCWCTPWAELFLAYRSQDGERAVLPGNQLSRP